MERTDEVMISAYYFRQHMYTLVPRHVREDMAWMAEAGTRAVCLAVLEQDLYAAEWNIEIVCREAEACGMEVFAVPSRWGGIVAGAPKVPSYFTATHPETWVLNEDGSPHYNSVHGPVSSVHHPATREFYERSLERLVTRWPIRGIVWDEIKTLQVRDCSPAAQKVIPVGAPLERHIDATVGFFDGLNGGVRRTNPGVSLSLFVYSTIEGPAVERFARMVNLDYFGCDGRPWRWGDQGAIPDERKVLLGQAERFMDAARRNGKGGLILVENHDMHSRHYDLMDRRLPEVLALGARHILYYYYPRNLDDPERNMAVMRKHLLALKR